MKVEKNKRQALLSWLVMSALLLLCGVLGWLQYRWIGEVSAASRDRLRASLEGSLNRLSQDFNSDLGTACRALVPFTGAADTADLEGEVTALYDRWKSTSRHAQMFSRIALAIPGRGSERSGPIPSRDREGAVTENQTVALRMLDLETGAFHPAAWPDDWKATRERMEARMLPREDTPQHPGPGGRLFESEGAVFELPLIGMPAPGSQPQSPPGPFPRRERGWLIFELNTAYAAEAMLPELVQKHFGAASGGDYEVEVVTRAQPRSVIYSSDPGAAKRIDSSADASMGLFDVPFDLIFRRTWIRGGPRGREAAGPGREAGPVRPPRPDAGRWQMLVRHRAGSLEAVVAQARWRNLAVTAGVLLLMIASVGALVRFTRRAQKLAELQLDFVAGVSHELRTPLTVIHTAAYNLRGKLAGNPSHVERYGALIQQESGRLKDLVEQILRFANARAGRVIQQPEPLYVQNVIDESLESTKSLVGQYRCVVEKQVDDSLPPIMGDPVSLKHALQNLITNAAKYGCEGSNWIGVSGSRDGAGEDAAIEIRVADHGPGIPADELVQIFDPFFRGRRALQDQIHGTGLGLCLVKEIVEAHGGTVAVHSAEGKGTEFVLRFPPAPHEKEDEFAHSFGRG